MKVAVLHNLTAGGARRRLMEQVSRLDVETVEITTSTAEPVTLRPIVVPLRPMARKVSAVLRPPLRYRDLWEVRRAWDRMGELADAAGADMIFANPDRFMRGAVGFRDAPLPVVRYCDEPRRVDYEPAVSATRNPATRRLYADLHRREMTVDRAALQDSTGVLTNSSYTAAGIAEAYGVAAEVVVSGVPGAMTAAGPAAAPHVLSVGSLLPSKGHDIVVEAVSLSGRDLPLVVVAHHPDRAEEHRLKVLARRHGVDLTIHVGITDEQLAELYRGAFALLYMAAREPLGLVSLEAQACGCRVILADEGGLPETLRRPENGCVVPRDAASAAAALRSLSDDRAGGDGATPASIPRSTDGWRLSAIELQRHFELVVDGEPEPAVAVGPRITLPHPSRTPRPDISEQVI